MPVKFLRKPLTLGHALIVLVLVITVGGGAFAVASIPGPDGVVKVCYKKSGAQKGNMRAIDSSRRCTASERTLRLNQRGPRGLQGLAGARGSAGANGQQGIQGAAGANGQQGIQGAAGVNGQQGAPGTPGAQGAAGAAGATNVVVRTTSGSISGGALSSSATKNCDAGERAVGGGGRVQSQPSNAAALMDTSTPMSGGTFPDPGETPNGWQVRVVSPAAAFPAGMTLHVYVVCASP